MNNKRSEEIEREESHRFASLEHQWGEGDRGCGVVSFRGRFRLDVRYPGLLFARLYLRLVVPSSCVRGGTNTGFVLRSMILSALRVRSSLGYVRRKTRVVVREGRATVEGAMGWSGGSGKSSCTANRSSYAGLETMKVPMGGRRQRSLVHEDRDRVGRG